MDRERAEFTLNGNDIGAIESDQEWSRSPIVIRSIREGRFELRNGIIQPSDDQCHFTGRTTMKASQMMPFVPPAIDAYLMMMLVAMTAPRVMLMMVWLILAMRKALPGDVALEKFIRNSR